MTLPKRKYHSQVKPGAKIPHPRILEQLIRGYNLIDGRSELPEAMLKKHWHKSKDYIMSLIGETVESAPFFGEIAINFGERPAAWWLFSSPEPRRLLEGDPAAALPGYGFHLGKPKVYRTLKGFNTVKHETQAEFLKRHRLLLPGEAGKIKR